MPWRFSHKQPPGWYASAGTLNRFPILSYDTDTKLGYGAKLFLYDLFKVRESFDMVFFNSTNGEKWYRFVVSLPDYESREGMDTP